MPMGDDFQIDRQVKVAKHTRAFLGFYGTLESYFDAYCYNSNNIPMGTLIRNLTGAAGDYCLVQ